MAASSQPSGLARHLAVVILPPEHVRERLDVVREQHDKAFATWPAHIRLLWPAPAQLDASCVRDELAAALLQRATAFDLTIRVSSDREGSPDGASQSEARGKGKSNVKGLRAVVPGRGRAGGAKGREESKKSKDGRTYVKAMPSHEAEAIIREVRVLNRAPRSCQEIESRAQMPPASDRLRVTRPFPQVTQVLYSALPGSEATPPTAPDTPDSDPLHLTLGQCASRATAAELERGLRQEEWSWEVGSVVLLSQKGRRRFTPIAEWPLAERAPADGGRDACRSDASEEPASGLV
eukprot:CAMPEP_0205905614 /NCGR_PEP_ID=MMETSP1325-20131115/1452_1 /ASSEMBLY_ACC=CAM_ASM_000708 /TAXON_ID=236786 /ORGANISM="Florenciella sp., Strain RCC1007" /LENGTH=292 /DNA_ID=CAMNT_0053271535 /DNA_START=1 /DNA_END=878 /DNA_ORIENTATION=+